jgi:putative transposase
MDWKLELVAIPALRKLPSEWTRSFFLSTAGNVGQKTIQNYIEKQSRT